jgi:hypothetical protein
MRANITWKLVERKMAELRALTDDKWKNSEWELAALGERVLRAAENSISESEALRANTRELQASMKELVEQIQYQEIFQNTATRQIDAKLGLYYPPFSLQFPTFISKSKSSVFPVVLHPKMRDLVRAHQPPQCIFELCLLYK